MANPTADRYPRIIQLKQGTRANLTAAATTGLLLQGEPLYTTDTKQLFIADGTFVPIHANSFLEVTIQTAAYVITVQDQVIVCNSATAYTQALPAATGSGRILIISNINTGAVTLDGDSSDTINGLTTQILNQWDSVQIVDYAANKWVVI